MRHPWILLLALACNGTTDGDGDDTDTDVDAPLDWPNLTCDPIIDYCGFPFPSNVYTVADDTTPTGRRVALSEGMMPRTTGAPPSDPTVFNKADGFSPGGPLMAHFPGAAPTGLPGPDDIGASLEDDSPVLLWDTVRRERVPCWAELDVLGRKGLDDATLLIYPAIRLEDETRYVVGIRHVVDGSGALVAPTAAMQDLIDGTGERRVLYDDILTHLTDNEWERGEVQVAWDFTTRSKRDITGWLVHMRDTALDLVGDAGPSFTIDSVEDDWNTDHVAFRIFGTFQAPLFLDQVEPGAQLLFDADGMPMINASTPTMDVPFEVLIPNSAVSEGPKALMMYGHGLFGEKEQVESSHFRSFIDEYGYVMFGIDLIGMADDDAGWLQDPLNTPLATASMHETVRFHDRLHQGFLNHVLMMRLMKTGFADDATYGGYVNADEAYYHGISQGGIMGVVHAALSQDFERAALGVMGQPYTVLLPRSVDFTPFFDILKIPLIDGRDIWLAMALAQQTWTRVEPDGWSAYVTESPIDAHTPLKQLLLRDALGDHQVPTIGAHVLARTIGAKHVESGLRELWGLTAVASTDGESGLMEYDFGLPPVPPCNVPMSLCGDPHGKVRSLESARLQLDTFFRLGRIKNECTDDLCSFSELSECEAGEDAVASEALCE